MVGSIYLVMGIAVLYPIGHLFLSSFRIDRPGEPSVWTSANFREVFASSQFISALENTLIVSVESVVLAIVLGVLLALFIARTDMPFKKVLEPLNMIPFYLSSLVGALSWEVLAAPKTGILNQLARNLLNVQSPPFNIYSLGGMSLVIGLFYAPFVYLFTVGTLHNMDPSLEDAGRACGASVAHTLLRITLPLATPAILSASILVFVTAAGIFGVPLMLGGPVRLHMLSTLIYRYIHFYPPDYNSAAALSSILLIITVLLVIVQRKILARRRFWTVTGKGFRPRLISLGHWRWLAFGIDLAYLALVLLPFVILVFISFLPGWTGKLRLNGFGLKNYYTVLFVDDSMRRGFSNSIIIALLGVTIGIVFCTLLAAFIQRTRLPKRSGVEFIAMLPLTYPGITLGLGFLIAWIRTPLFGTLWILMLAYIVHYIPTGVRSMEAALASISPDLDECARVSGCKWSGALRRILLPLMWPSLMSTWLLLFVIFIREVSSSMMLYVHGTETISIALIRSMEYQPQGVIAAFGCLQTLIILIAVVLLRKLSSGVGIRTGVETGG